MEIEQVSPKKPNFSLILGLFCLTLLLTLVVAYFFVDLNGKHLTLRHHSAHPTSQLILPAHIPPPARA